MSFMAGKCDVEKVVLWVNLPRPSRDLPCILDAVFLVKRGLQSFQISLFYQIFTLKIFSVNWPVGRALPPRESANALARKNPTKAETQIFWFLLKPPIDFLDPISHSFISTLAFRNDWWEQDKTAANNTGTITGAKVTHPFNRLKFHYKFKSLQTRKNLYPPLMKTPTLKCTPASKGKKKKQPRKPVARKVSLIQPIIYCSCEHFRIYLRMKKRDQCVQKIYSISKIQLLHWNRLTTSQSHNKGKKSKIKFTKSSLKFLTINLTYIPFICVVEIWVIEIVGACLIWKY